MVAVSKTSQIRLSSSAGGSHRLGATANRFGEDAAHILDFQGDVHDAVAVVDEPPALGMLLASGEVSTKVMWPCRRT